MIATDEVCAPARLAARSPAGPAPTITTSKRETSVIASDPHARRDSGKAGALMGATVDGNTALVTDTHSAQRRARLATDGQSQWKLGVHNGGGHGDSTRHHDGDPVHHDLKEV